MTGLLSVAVGGALGSVARYVVGMQIMRWLCAGFPWGTLTVNVAGCFLIGILAETMAAKWPVSPETRLFLVAGVLGGFTTFSAFSLEVVAVAQRGAVSLALLYVIASVVLSVGAVVLGMMLVRWTFG